MNDLPFSRRDLLKSGTAGVLLAGVAPPVVAAQSVAEDATVYVGSFDNNVSAVDAVTGDKQWVFKTRSTIQSSPTVVDGTVYFGSQDSTLYAVEAATGDQQWDFNTGSAIQSSPTVVNDTVYIGTGSFNTVDNNLYAVNAATGEQRWVFDTGDGVRFSSPTVVNGTVYIGSDDSNLYAVDAATGDQRWAFKTGDGVFSSPTVVDGTVYVGSQDSNLYAVEAATGDEQWAFETGDGVLSSPAVVDGTVYVGSYDGALYALDATDGTEKWRFDTGDVVFSSPTVADGTIYIGNWDHNLYAVEAGTGDQLWAFDTGGTVDSSPTVIDGTVFVGSQALETNNLYAVEAATGDELWAFDTGGIVKSSPTVVADPATGDSVGSRVNLGTLGHHQEWTDNQSEPSRPEPSPDDPIEIRDWHDLDAVRTDLNADYRLVADLDVGTAGYNEHIGGVENGWEPIGEFDPENDRIEVFRGSFDGNGHTIGDVQIDRPNEDYVGLFARTRGAQISDLELVNVAVTGQNLVGALAGASGGISRCYTSGVVTGNEQVGGLVGYSFAGDITLSYADVDVTGSFSIGGLIGLNDHDGQIADSYSTGAVTGDGHVGGLVGESYYGTIANAYVTGAVSGDFDTGGLVGQVGLSTHSQKDEAIVANSYWDTHTTGQSDAVGVFKSGDGTVELRGDIAGLTTAEMQGDSAKEQMAAFDFNRTWQTATDPDGYPILQWQEDGTDSSQPEGFDPATHGFGFKNYDTPAPPEWSDLFNIVGDFVDELQATEVFGPTVGPLKRLALTGLIYSGFKGAWTNGHCLGMVLTAREYYETEFPELPGYSPDVDENEWPLPLSVPPETAADITEKPRTKPELDPIESDIDLYQHRQSFDSSYSLRYVATAAVENNDLDLINYEAVIEATQEQLSNGVPALLGLIDNIDSGHAVLAYEIELENINEPVQSITDATRVDVSVYDPNSSAVNYYDQDPYFITFSRPSTQDEFQMVTYSSGGFEYSEAMFVEEVDPDYEFFAGEDATDAYKVALSEGLNNYLSVGVMSPVTVEITGPGETTLRRLDVDSELLLAETKYETVYYAMDIDPGEYDIEITGTGTGEYTIEVEGETTNGGTIAESYTGRITEDETQNLTVMLPTESDQIGQLQAEEPSTDADTDDNSLLFGLSETEIAAGGVVSVAMVYAAVRMLSDSEGDGPDSL